jgi:hypothetical protein
MSRAESAAASFSSQKKQRKHEGTTYYLSAPEEEEDQGEGQEEEQNAPNLNPDEDDPLLHSSNDSDEFTGFASLDSSDDADQRLDDLDFSSDDDHAADTAVLADSQPQSGQTSADLHSSSARTSADPHSSADADSAVHTRAEPNLSPLTEEEAGQDNFLQLPQQTPAEIQTKPPRKTKKYVPSSTLPNPTAANAKMKLDIFTMQRLTRQFDNNSSSNAVATRSDDQPGPSGLSPQAQLMGVPSGPVTRSKGTEQHQSLVDGQKKKKKSSLSNASSILRGTLHSISDSINDTLDFALAPYAQPATPASAAQTRFSSGSPHSHQPQ